MWVYYQTVENCNQKWKLVKSDDVKKVSEDIYHLNIYQLDKLPDAVEPETIRYKGDLWFDIDHKALDEKEESKNDALDKSILDLQRLISFLELKGVNPDDLRCFASGSKGFHVRVSSSLFGHTTAKRYLPKIHKYMANQIAEESNMEGVDAQLYLSGRGSLLRTENLKRSNGHYKVAITASECKVMTPELYKSITSKPRNLSFSAIDKTKINSYLVILFEEADSYIKEAVKHKSTNIPSEYLEGFVNNHPVCVDWLVSNINISSSLHGKFNQAKMSLARYLLSSPVSEEEKEAIISTFTDNWESSQNTTKQSRERAVQATLSSWKNDHEFSCGFMKAILTENPCKSCPVKQKQNTKLSESLEIQEINCCYCKESEKSGIQNITNFTLLPVRKFEVEDTQINTFSAYDYNVSIQNTDGNEEQCGCITIPSEAWVSVREFRKLISKFNTLNFLGTDNDLQLLKTYLTSPALLSGVKIMRTIKTIGVYRHIDKQRGINEYTWVQPNWSINNNIPPILDTVMYIGNQSDIPSYVDVSEVKEEEIDLDVFKAMMRSSKKEIVATMVGWMCACWLKPKLMESNSKHFPILSLWGLAGAGKTTMSSSFSYLAGADYTNGDSPTSTPSATVYSLKQQASSSTSVPRIWDEFNKNKFPSYSLFKTTFELIKSCASSNSLPQGFLKKGNHTLSNSSAQIDNRIASTPLIVLSTEEPQEKEFQDRATSLHINESGKEETEDDYLFFEEHVQSLRPLVKHLMMEALRLGDKELNEFKKFADDSIPKTYRYRVRKNWLVPLVGLRFLTYVVEKYYPTLTSLVTQSTNDLICYLEREADEITGKTNKREIEVILDKLGEIACTSINEEIVEGTHYLIDGDYLHLFLIGCFPVYIRHEKLLGLQPMISNLTQFKNLIKTQDYFLGTGLVQVENLPNDWFTFDIPKLKDKGVHVERFLQS